MVLRSRPSRSLSQTALISSLALPLVYGCAVATPVDGTGGGAATASGGSGVPGGGSSSGGAQVNPGGGPSTGGSLGSMGGSVSSGGAAPGGGSSSGGGGNVGGGPPAGGGEGVGGGAPAGGGTGTGGAPGGGKWGEVEDPGAACTVGPMPSVGSLKANPKLPDPFTKMDGTRMTSKSEWMCRREEILRQGMAFIFGEKPIPPKDAVTGTVSSSSISVKVTGGKKDATFNVTVSMNGATAPAPAIISYGAGAPVPSGVAKITFTAIEGTGGSGPKNGPFFDYYGSDHPAGYLTAQAWQVSRIIDVLEKTPGTIDPHKIGVTGCSRNGKGAFVGGVLDNRIALTIPVESGISGTVGLRLVEQIDSYSGSEWPYHGISYVRWHSEVALGQFTTGNSASADNTDKLPVDMHEMMALIAPRGLYVVDNPSTMYNGLDRNGAWVTGNVGKMIFEGLGVGDHFSYQGAGGSHCSWRTQYDASLKAMIDKFLKGDTSAATGNVATDLPNKPDHKTHIDWEVPTLSGEL
jgi:hypothetical protein